MALQLKFNPLTGQFDYVQDISGKTDKVNPSTQDGVVKFSDTVGTQADATVGNYAVKIIDGKLVPQRTDLTNTLIIGAGSDVTGNNAMSLGSNATAGLDAMAIGANSSCTGTDALSIGNGVSHTRNQSIAIGTSATSVNGTQSIAIGDGANAAGGSCIAIGYTATTGINLGLAIGWEANSTGTISSALGPGCDALALFSSCVGVNTTVESGNSVACGPFANIGTSANQSVAIGNSATVNNNASQGVAIGNSAVVGAGDVGSMAFGAGASTTAANQLLLGGTTGVTDAYIGKGVTNATPLSITVQPTGETGTDSTNTADFHLAGSKGTGTGTGGSVKIQVGVAGTTGTTLNTLEDVVVITSDKSTELKGGVVKPVLTVTAANTTLSATDYHVLCDASSNTVTIDLPAAASHTGREYSIKAIDVTSSVTVDGNGSETIDGSLTQVLPLNATMKIISNGTGWFII